jgi:hypothetical protein
MPQTSFQKLFYFTFWPGDDVTRHQHRLWRHISRHAPSATYVMTCYLTWLLIGTFAKAINVICDLLVCLGQILIALTKHPPLTRTVTTSLHITQIQAWTVSFPVNKFQVHCHWSDKSIPYPPLSQPSKLHENMGVKTYYFCLKWPAGKW